MDIFNVIDITGDSKFKILVLSGLAELTATTPSCALTFASDIFQTIKILGVQCLSIALFWDTTSGKKLDVHYRIESYF